jgi:hypothetical protein
VRAYTLQILTSPETLLKSEEATLLAQQKLLSCSESPKSFQDAINITRGLGMYSISLVGQRKVLVMAVIYSRALIISKRFAFPYGRHDMAVQPRIRLRVWINAARIFLEERSGSRCKFSNRHLETLAADQEGAFPVV